MIDRGHQVILTDGSVEWVTEDGHLTSGQLERDPIGPWRFEGTDPLGPMNRQELEELGY